MHAFVRTPFVIALALPVLGGAPAPLLAQDAGDVIDRVLEAYGGAERLAEVHGYELEGAIMAHSRNDHGSVRRTYHGSDRMLVDVRYTESRELRALVGDSAWRGTSNQDARLVSGPLKAAMILQAARASIPWILEEYRAAATYVANPHGHDEAMGLVVLDLPDDMKLRLVLDLETYRIVRSQGALRMGPQEVVFETAYSDFREVDGVLFAFGEENYASGMHTATTRVNSIQLNPEIPGEIAR